MDVHLIDGTFELFRHFYAVPPTSEGTVEEVGAVRGVVASVLSMLEKGATHLGVATDKIIESFRNDLYPYYKTSEGIHPKLWSQFPLLEEALEALGVKVWAMVEFEADDALASAAAKAAEDERVGKVIICTPDKDLGQCVVGQRVVQLDRMRNITRDEAGVIEKFGIKPESIPDYLALVGDSADGFPGIQRWGAKAAATVLAVYPHLEDIPKDPSQWKTTVRGSATLAKTLSDSWQDALLFRTLATLRRDVDVFASVDDLKWKGPRLEFEAVSQRLKAPDLHHRADLATSSATSS